MVVTSRDLTANSESSETRSFVSIPTSPTTLPIEVTVTGKLPPGAGSFLVANSLWQQQMHPEFLDEYNEPSALIGKTNFEKSDSTAVYTFAVDKRDLVFHCHGGHRAITGITGGKGALLKFSLCSPEDAYTKPQKFLDNLWIVKIPGDRMFVLRFQGSVYHQFCPADRNENGFFAISIHTNEAGGLSGELLEAVLAGHGNIPLLTEPAPDAVIELLARPGALDNARHISLDIE